MSFMLFSQSAVWCKSLKLLSNLQTMRLVFMIMGWRLPCQVLILAKPSPCHDKSQHCSSDPLSQHRFSSKSLKSSHHAWSPHSLCISRDWFKSICSQICNELLKYKSAPNYMLFQLLLFLIPLNLSRLIYLLDTWAFHEIRTQCSQSWCNWD